MQIDVSQSPGTPRAATIPAGDSVADLGRAVRELVAVNRELLHVSREQLELLRRAEERFQKQHEGQREEFARWLTEHPELEGRCEGAHESVRRLFGRSLAELVDYIHENEDSLLESDFVKNDMVDRYGALLNHVSAMYGVLKRLVQAEQPH